MARFRLTIECDNAAFTGEDAHGAEFPQPGPEVARILRKLASRVEELDGREADTWAVLDLNGNRVGEAKYQPRTYRRGRGRV